LQQTVKQNTDPAQQIPKPNTAKKIAFTAMFSALAAVVMMIEFPLTFIAPDFYKIDLSEIPVLICAFLYGPLSGVTAELIKNLIHLALGSKTGGIGELANFLIGCAFVLPASFIYKFKKSKSFAVLGMTAGTVAMSLAGVILNAYVLIPVYARLFNAPVEAIVAAGTSIIPAINNLFTFCLFSVTPFNLIKGILISAATFFLYKPLGKLLSRFSF